MAAISRTLVEGTWLKMLRYQCTTHLLIRSSSIVMTLCNGLDLDRLRHDPLMKVVVGRCPQTGAPLASQSTISHLENAPSKTEAGRLSAALLDQFGTTVKPGKLEVLDIDDTFCAAHGGQQLAFWGSRAPVMEWSGRAPAPPASEVGKGVPKTGARHVSEAQQRDCRDWRRYR